MKVLESKDWGKWRHVCTCRSCESKLEADPNDLIHSPATGGNSHDHCSEYFFVRCPVCTQQIVIDQHEIPSFLKKQARNRLGPPRY